jgi:hypothetical protein
MTAAPHFESARRFKTLALQAKTLPAFANAKLFLPAVEQNHFRCGK